MLEVVGLCCENVADERHYMHTASLGMRDGLISSQVTTSSRAFRRGLDVVTSAEISQSRHTNNAVCIFSYEYLFETVKSD